MARLSIYEIASKYTSLKPRGNGAYYGLCPLHNEDTPSFHINDNLGVFYCHGCKKGGNVYQFISYSEGIPLSEVNKFIRDKWGYNVDDSFYKAKEDYPLEDFISIIEKNNLSDDTFVKNFLLQRLGQIPNIGGIKFYYLNDESERNLLKILKKDSILLEKLKTFSVVYVSDTDSLRFSFSGRIFTELKNSYGRTIAIIGRHISDGKVPKYHMTRFPKKEHLIFLNQAIKIANSNKEKRVFVTEGIFDSLQLLANNIPSVAILGSYISTEQMDKLNQNFTSVYFVFDGDEAGYNAIETTAKNIIETNRPSFSSYFVFLGDKDVDELIRDEGLEALYNLKTRSVYDALIDVSLKKLVGLGIKRKEILREELFIKFINIFKMYKENAHAYNLLVRFSERSQIPLETLIFRIDLEKKKDSASFVRENYIKDFFLSISDKQVLRALLYCVKNGCLDKYRGFFDKYRSENLYVNEIIDFYLEKKAELTETSYSILVDLKEASSEEYVENIVKRKETNEKVFFMAKKLLFGR